MKPNNPQTPPPQQEGEATPLDQVRGILNFFRPPIFKDNEDKTRRAAILNATFIIIFAFMVLYGLAQVAFSNNPLVSLGLISALLLFIGFNFFTLKRGHLNLAAYIFSTSLWILLATASTLTGELINPLLPTLALVILIAGFVIDSQASLIFLALSIIYTLGLYLVTQYTTLPAILQTDGVSYTIRMALIFFLTAFFMIVSNRNINQAFQRVRTSQKSLEDRNKELSDLREYLEDQVHKNTQQLIRRTNYLESASQVASKSLSTLNLQDMLDSAVKLISEQFGFYHVGIFLLDEDKKWAVLRAASSPGGKQMIERMHRLEVGKQGMVGFASSFGRARISQDINLDYIHSKTSELPETRAEMSLPMIARDQIIGVLDIQDTNPQAFTQDDISILQTMTNQISLAVENIRLYQQTQTNLTEIERLYGQYSQQSWKEAYQRNLLSSYRYSKGVIEPVSEKDNFQPEGNLVSIPIIVRGTQIGTIDIAKDNDQSSWTNDELKLLESLSEQLGIAVDSARLFNESQLRATTEHVIGQISADIWEHMEIDSILKTAADNLRQSLAVPEVTISMVPASRTAPEDEIEEVKDERS